MKKINIILLTILQLFSLEAEQSSSENSSMVTPVITTIADTAFNGYIIHRILKAKVPFLNKPQHRVIASGLIAASMTIGTIAHLDSIQENATIREKEENATIRERMVSVLQNNKEIVTTKIIASIIPAVVTAVPTPIWLPGVAVAGWVLTAKIMWTKAAPMMFRGAYLTLSALFTCIDKFEKKENSFATEVNF